MYPNLQSDGHEYHSCKTDVESETSRDNIKSNDGLSGVIDQFGKAQQKILPPAVGLNLDQPADSLVVGMEDGTLVLEVLLLALHDHRPSIDEEQQNDEGDDHARRDEEDVDLADVHQRNYGGCWALEHVDYCHRQGVVQNTQVIGEFVD